MSGIEIAGIVLKTLPLIISNVEIWRECGIAALRKRKYADKLARALLFQKTTISATIHLLATKSGCECDEKILEYDPIGYLRQQDVQNQIEDFLGEQQTAVFLGALRDIESTLKRVSSHISELVPIPDAQKDDLVSIINANLASKKSKVDLIPRVKILFSSNEMKKAVEDLDVVTNSLCRFSQLVLMSSTAPVVVESSQNTKLAKGLRQIRNLATGLYTALCHNCRGPCHSDHEANVFLEDRMDIANGLMRASHRKCMLKSSAVSFRLLFTATLPTPMRYHETLIRVMEQDERDDPSELTVPFSQVKIIVPEREDKPTTDACDRAIINKVSPVENFCAAIISAAEQAQPLAFVLHTTNKIGTMIAEERMIFRKDNSQRVPLRLILSMSSTQEFPLRLRMLLALRLASSLLQLSQTRWTGQTWSKDSVFFLTHPISDGMQPYVDFNRAFVCATLDGFDAQSVVLAEPKLMLLELGILLLEIWHQKTLEARFGLGEDDAPKDYYIRLARAVEWLENTDNPPLDLYRGAIVYCIRGNIGQGQLAWGTPELWNGVCKEIIDPLFKNCKQWS